MALVGDPIDRADTEPQAEEAGAMAASAIGRAFAAGQGWTLSMRIADFDFDPPRALTAPRLQAVQPGSSIAHFRGCGGSKIGRSPIYRHRCEQATSSFQRHQGDPRTAGRAAHATRLLVSRHG